MGSVPDPTRSTPECERGGREEQSTLSRVTGCPPWPAGQLRVSHFGGPTSGKGPHKGEETGVESLPCTWRTAFP